MLRVVRAFPPDTAARRQDPLLTTKLFPPPLQESFVPRPRLSARLHQGLTGGVILLSAPAGFGKSALLADWARQRPVAWLSLDAADNDPMRFWRHALAALDGVRPGTTERLMPALDLPASPSFEGLVTGLINDFTGDPRSDEATLVLDDYQMIESQTIHQALSFLVEHRPEHLHLVVASRTDPPLRLARVRAAGQLTELRADDLRFTSNEAAALLGRALGPNLRLPDASVTALVARTEGWGVGLRLAAVALEGRTDAAAFVDTFSGGHRYILDYLTEEVLERQPEQVRSFLLETSVLERMTGALCDAVTGRTDGAAMLDAVDRANLFLVALDEVRGWWRYHQLFADLLRARLQQQQQPDRIEGLHRNAAGWYERNGMADDAIRHALAAGDSRWAARMIEREVDAALLRNEEATIERWLAALPTDVVDTRPRLLLVKADLALSRGRLEAVDRALDAAERAIADDAGNLPGDPAADLAINVPAAVAFWRAYVAELRGDADSALAFDRQALAALGDVDSVLGSVVRVHLRTIDLLSGEVRDIERDLEAHFRSLHAAGQVYLAMRAIELLGHVQRARGRLDLADETYRQGLAVAGAPDRPSVAAAGIAYIGLAQVAYQRGDLDMALKHASEGIALCERLAYHRPLASGLATIARIRLARGDVAGAVATVEKAPQVAPSRGVTALLNPLPVLRAHLALIEGDLAGAIRWTKDRGLRPDDQVSYPQEPEYLILARVLLEQGRFDQALTLLGQMHERAQAQGRAGNALEILVLRSVTLAAAGDEAAAMASLAEALAIGYPQGYVRVFADEGLPMGTLLSHAVVSHRTALAGVPLGYLGQLLRAVEHDARPGGSAQKRPGAGIPGLVEALSPRELDVLRLLATGKPNRDIADELYVTVDTVKKHVTHIFQKLGATNRTEATARARDLGLLDEAATPTDPHE